MSSRLSPFYHQIESCICSKRSQQNWPLQSSTAEADFLHCQLFALCDFDRGGSAKPKVIKRDFCCFCANYDGNSQLDWMLLCCGPHSETVIIEWSQLDAILPKSKLVLDIFNRRNYYQHCSLSQLSRQNRRLTSIEEEEEDGVDDDAGLENVVKNIKFRITFCILNDSWAGLCWPNVWPVKGCQFQRNLNINVNILKFIVPLRALLATPALNGFQK